MFYALQAPRKFMPLKIGFHSNAMTIRGTEIALYDYAFFNQAILGNQSIIYYNPKVSINDANVISKFKEQFELIPYENFKTLDHLANSKKIDAMYLIKSGERDERILNEVPCLMHAVFPQPPRERHGHVYAFVSEWLSKEYSNFKTPYVPHIATLPNVQSNLRTILNIPVNALVLGCHGGHDSFNIEFAKNIVLKTLKMRTDLFFVFLNIPPFGDHERLIFLKGNASLDYKTQFINTCDAMLHARNIGESFGLACAEFSLRNKPVITYALSPQRSHLEILGSKAISYSNSKDLQDIIMHMESGWIKSHSWDCYSKKFAPETVMKKFESVFLTSLKQLPKETIQFSIRDHGQVLAFQLRRKIHSFLRKFYNLIF
jgi:hypothetical protein